MKDSRRRVRAGFVIAAAVFLFGGLNCAFLRTEMQRSQKGFDILAQGAAAAETLQSDGSDPCSPGDRSSSSEDRSSAAVPQNAERFAALIGANADFAAWIRIDGTGVNYPVMCCPEEPDRYLRRDFDGAYSVSGTPYIGAGCSPESDNAIIYGHNMKNGTMFSDLLRYAEEDFYSGHRTVSFDTVDFSADYEIIAVFREKVHYRDETGVFRYYDYAGDLSPEAFDEYLSQIKALSLYDTGVTAQYGDRLITLSTCSSHTKNGRFVVVAKRPFL